MAKEWLSPQSITLLLAYVQYYTCKHLPGRFISATHLRQIARWIGKPDDNLVSVRQHPVLAMHLFLAAQAGLLSTDGDTWVCTPAVYEWLTANYDRQIELLSAPLWDGSKWEQTVITWRLETVLTIDFTAYARQSLERQRQNPPEAASAEWFPGSVADEWFLRLPKAISPKLLFHMIQFGEWLPDESLHCTKLTLTKAMRHGYAPRTIGFYVAQATAEPFPAQALEQLYCWFRELDNYTVEAGFVLSTKQPQYLAEIMAQQRLRKQVLRQLSPRHALVSETMVEPLQRWLSKREYSLNDLTHARQCTEEQHQPVEPNAAHTWLALRVFIGLAEFIEIPTPLPHASLETAEHKLQSPEKTLLEHKAITILNGIQDAIRGRDAFFPATHHRSEKTIQVLKEAVFQGQAMEILYCGLVDREARWRQIEPLRLEERGNLVYIHAYCRLAEDNRIFRADRIEDCRSLEPV